ncbi:apoptosis-associated speck-like protein containing a CARD [Pyxicephalus adspersus]|uniref:apoptosis-associated speck-like protein containing a CARD n=1 Tax=Pyxicephalus adspersus TaxID=30357 RepID=UPI003B5901D7
MNIQGQITSQEVMRELLRINNGHGDPHRDQKNNHIVMDEPEEEFDFDLLFWIFGLDHDNLLTGEDTIHSQTINQDPRELDMITRFWGEPHRGSDFETDETSEETNSEPVYVPSKPRSAPKKHFVDEHREALINGVTQVAPILDSLMSADLLTYEDRATILMEGTSYAQMRKLYYGYVRTWNKAQKDVLYEALKRNNRVLVDNLQRGQP